MKLQRQDWLVADGETMAKANGWWRWVSAGVLLEAVLLGGLHALTALPGPWGSMAWLALCARVIMGSIGAWCWFSATPQPDFWSYESRWVMQFLPWALLSWRRKEWLAKLIGRLAEGESEKMIALAKEQYNFYSKGAGTSHFGHPRREMACWSGAACECKTKWIAWAESEKMKSAQARSEALAAAGLGRDNIAESLLLLEKLEIDLETQEASSAAGARRRL